MHDDTLLAEARALGDWLLPRGWRLATAESCTGGWIAKTITDLAGCSTWFERGWVTYSNAAKQQDLGVSGETIAEHGAVSAQTVVAMAIGAIARSRANVAVAVSGIAGPAGGSPYKPVGTVWLGYATDAGTTSSEHLLLQGDRATVRQQAVQQALCGLRQWLDTHAGSSR